MGFVIHFSSRCIGRGVRLSGIAICPECGVPGFITREIAWLDTGVIVRKSDPQHRLLFIECENIDPLYKGISRIIGESIEPHVVDIRRKVIRDVLADFFTTDIREQLRSGELDLAAVIAAQARATGLMGFGRVEFVDFSVEDSDTDFVSLRIWEPFSVPLWCGSLCGACEAILGGRWDVTCETMPPGMCELVARRSHISVEVSDEFRIEEYLHERGSVELSRCGTCDGPSFLSRFRWNLERGVIGSAFTDRRMCFGWEAGLQRIFTDLETELGEAVPRAVIEAQRRFMRRGFYTIEGLLSEGDFRTQFAYRGLGDLKEFGMGTTGLHLRLGCCSLHLTVVGFAQALFELAFERDSDVEWELADNDELKVEVMPRL
jgi:hypothetical protein